MNYKLVTIFIIIYIRKINLDKKKLDGKIHLIGYS